MPNQISRNVNIPEQLSVVHFRGGVYNLDFTGANPQLQLLYEIAEKAYTGFGLKYLEAKEL